MSELGWCSETGTEYLILVSGYEDNVGNFQLDVYDNGTPCEDPPNCEPEPGRCCYGDVYDPQCANVTQQDCVENLEGVWAADLTCEDYPCDVYGHFEADPASLSGFTDNVGPGNTDVKNVTISNTGGAMLVFTSEAVIDPPPISASFARHEHERNSLESFAFDTKHESMDYAGIETTPNLTLDFNGSETFDSDLGEFINVSNDGDIGANWLFTDADGSPAGSALHTFSTDYADDDYLISVGMYTVPDLEGISLIWDQKDDWSSDYLLHRVGVSTDYVSGDPDAATWTWIYSGVALEDAWSTESASLEAFRGQDVRIAFDYQGDNSDKWWIDNITVDVYIPPTGRCCFFGDMCVDEVTQSDCINIYNGTNWVEGVTCSEPCPVVPGCPEGTTMYHQNPSLPVDDWAFGISEADCGSYTAYKCYDNFGYLPEDIVGIRFWGVAAYSDGYSWYECSEDPTVLEVTFFEDDEGAPGAIVAIDTFSVVPTVVDDAGRFGGFSQLEYEITFDTPITASYGWISIEGIEDNSCWFLWQDAKNRGDGMHLAWNYNTSAYSVEEYDLSICFIGTEQSPWLTVDTDGGYILPGGEDVDITVTMDAEFLSCNLTYTGRVRFETNDPNNMDAAVDVEFSTCTSPCYQYVPGDANMYNGQWPVKIIGADVTYMVAYFRGINPPCLVGGFWNSADANGDCNIIGSDVTRMVSYFRGISAISHCADYDPCWLTPDDTESVPRPNNWPNCETGTPVSGTDLPSGKAK
jgi:hypothetical protein